MLASITPLGERGRNRNWAVTVAFYVVGSTAGGAVLGAGAGLIGVAAERVAHPSATPTLIVIGSAALAALLIDSRRSRRVPSIRRQVNEDWLRQYRSWVYGMGFGVQLGAGVATVVTSASTYLVLVVAGGAAAATRWPLAVVIGAVYGLARALPILVTARITTFPQLSRLHERLSAHQRGARRLTLTTELLVAVVAAGHVLVNR
jgi:hypothetical protein